jgi:alkanesulfonate monooxygenase SsuD/methylene tetrahydromethanopterin reductase-like flavin-dependent oxidoreductase (luciferase family)
MLIDTGAHIMADPGRVEAAAIATEADGYDGFGVPETRHDSFVSLALAARATSSITLQSGIAVALRATT